MQVFEKSGSQTKGGRVNRDKIQNTPIPSMYGIFTHIWFIFMVNVGKYTIHDG